MEEPRQPVPLPTEKHSLAPDMLFGWRPRQLKKKRPVPIFYLRSFTTKSLVVREVFHGPRPVDSFLLHQQFAGKSHYGLNVDDPMVSAWSFLSKKHLAKYPDRRPFIGTAPRRPAACLAFDASFEGANLDKVLMIDENRYELYLRPDTNSRSRQLWFYFAISGISSARVVELTIVNLKDQACVYDMGMKPVVFSKLNNKANPQLGWERLTSEIRYCKSRTTMTRHQYYQLTFSLELQAHDRVYVAPTFPYSCSDLWKFLGTLSPGVCKQSTLCSTLGGVSVPFLTITDAIVPKAKKKYVVIVSRLRPVDTYTSFISEGLLAYLTSDEASAKLARSRIIFKVLPMANPDGVLAGNTRSTLAGRDLNFAFSKPQACLQPVAHSLKKKLKQYSLSNRLLLFLTLEANYKKKGTFMFGPYYPIHEKRYYLSRMLPKFFSDQTPMFRYFACRFLPDQELAKQPYRVVWSETDALCYSLQTSAFAFLNKQRETIEYSKEDLRELGLFLGRSISEYMDLLLESEVREQQRARERLTRQYYAQRHLTEKKQGLRNVISSIQQAEANCDADSGIGQWSADEDEVDSQCTVEIIYALEHCSSDREEDKSWNEDSNLLRTQQPSQNRKLPRKASVQPTSKRVNSNLPKCLPVNRCMLGPESVVHQSHLPNLKPTLKHRKATSYVKLKPKGELHALLAATNLQTSYMFPKSRKPSCSTKLAKEQFLGLSKYHKFGPFPRVSPNNE